MLSIRQLPPNEFHRLPIQLDPATSIVVIAEDTTGELKGYWVAQAVIHIEPVQLMDEAQDGGVTALKMLQTLLATIAATGETSYYAFSDSPQISDYLLRLGLTAMPYQIFLGINPFLKDTQCPSSQSQPLPQPPLVAEQASVLP